MKFRPPREDDQENVEKAYQLIQILVYMHPEIESTLWASAMLSTFVNSFISSGHSYDDFCDEFDKSKLHYKSWWNNEDFEKLL